MRGKCLGGTGAGGSELGSAASCCKTLERRQAPLLEFYYPEIQTYPFLSPLFSAVL